MSELGAAVLTCVLLWSSGEIPIQPLRPDVAVRFSVVACADSDAGSRRLEVRRDLVVAGAPKAPALVELSLPWGDTPKRLEAP